MTGLERLCHVAEVDHDDDPAAGATRRLSRLPGGRRRRRRPPSLGDAHDAQSLESAQVMLRIIDTQVDGSTCRRWTT